MSSANAPEAVSKIDADTTCRRFGFAISQGRMIQERNTRRRATIAHLFSHLDSFDIIDEWDDGSRAWVVLEPATGVPVSFARLLAEETPNYIRGSFAVDRSR